MVTNLTGYYWGILEFGIRSARHKDPNKINVKSVILLARNEKNKCSKPFKIQTFITKLTWEVILINLNYSQQWNHVFFK